MHGHSTGGPFVHTLMQRCENVSGLIGVENSPFGWMFNKMTGHDWPTPFNYVLVRDWRELARYKGAELAMQEGEKPLFRLAQVMEELFELWDESSSSPQFKAENWFHNRTPSCLREAAQVAREIRTSTATETEALVEEYLDYGMPLTGPGTKPIPPYPARHREYRRDHTPENYRTIARPLRRARPAPKFEVIELGTGIHSYWRTEEGLPLRSLPSCRESVVRRHHERLVRDGPGVEAYFFTIISVPKVRLCGVGVYSTLLVSTP